LITILIFYYCLKLILLVLGPNWQANHKLIKILILKMWAEKIREQEVLIPILFGEIKTGAIDKPAKEKKILLDSGASGSIITKEFTQIAQRIPVRVATWRTMAGIFATNSKHIAEFLSKKCTLFWKSLITMQF